LVCTKERDYGLSQRSERDKPTDKVWTTDVTVPIRRSVDTIDDSRVNIEGSVLLGSILGQVGDGDFHALILFLEEERRIAERLVTKIVQNAIAMKGTTAGELGISFLKCDCLNKKIGQVHDRYDAKSKLLLPF
jgi:D-lactate dehydrogenase (cytochrome)